MLPLGGRLVARCRHCISRPAKSRHTHTRPAHHILTHSALHPIPPHPAPPRLAHALSHPQGPPAVPAAAQLPLMSFEGCQPVMATVLLKGGCERDLARLKRVMQFSAYAAWHARLELSYLADQMTAAVVAATGGSEGG